MCLGENFKMISSVSLQATHLVVFAHIQMIPLISQISHDDYATGFKNTMGNKGGVTIRFKLAKTSIRVITGHFHSGQHNLAARNRDMNEIFQAFCTNQSRGQRNQVVPSSKLPEYSDDVLIFMGDLNYRINGE